MRGEELFEKKILIFKNLVGGEDHNAGDLRSTEPHAVYYKGENAVACFNGAGK